MLGGMLTTPALRVLSWCAVGMMLASAATVARADRGCAVSISGCFAKAKSTSARKAYHVTVNMSGPSSAYFDQHRAVTPRKAPTARNTCPWSGLDTTSCSLISLLAECQSLRDPITYSTITPDRAAVVAAAYLRLEPGQPTVGPPPELNKWKMAAVGYPLWIWAEGDLDPAPVSQTVSGLSVSLDASLAKIVYDMGDGTRITCGPGTPWRKGKVPAGTASPDCGHTYSKPSLPKGSYTISATTHWSVAWTAGGQSGTIPFTQTSTTTLPVGEVQTLVR